MKICQKFASLLLLVSTAIYSNSRFSVVDFAPYVSIHQETVSSSLNIITESNYVANYDKLNHSFSPLLMNFKVVSSGALPEEHAIQYAFQEHYCKDEGGTVETPIENVVISINEHAFTTDYKYITFSSEVTHTLKLEFPIIIPKVIEQNCYGIVGIFVSSRTI